MLFWAGTGTGALDATFLSSAIVFFVYILCLCAFILGVLVGRLRN